MKNERWSLRQMLNKKNCDNVQIPDIQRDYVLGSSGGHLKKLLDSMMQVANETTGEFDFSNIVVSLDNKTMSIYDGQQRITTLIVLLLCCENMETEEKKLLEKYQFIGRESANKYLKRLIGTDTDPTNSKKIEIDFTSFVDDHTTFSINKLHELATREYKDLLNKDFLFDRVMFNVTQVNKKADAEQFFLDLNDGVALKDYELFKAKLNDRIEKLKNNWLEYGASLKYAECLNKWAHKMDNEWLYFFKVFLVLWKKEHLKSSEGQESICYLFEDIEFKIDAKIWSEFNEEQLEMEFIFYCLQMVIYESGKKKPDEVFCNLEQVNVEEIYRIYKIIESVVQKQFCKIDSKEKVVLYSFCAPYGITRYGGPEKEPTQERFVDMYRGTYWNMQFEDYERLLQLHLGRLIHEMLLLKQVMEKEKFDSYVDATNSGNQSNNVQSISDRIVIQRNKYISEYSKDIVLWAYITHLDDKKSDLRKYLRIIKRLANNNLSENKNAWMCAQVWGFKIYYTRYIVRNIPRYYLEKYYWNDKDMQFFCDSSDCKDAEKIFEQKWNNSNKIKEFSMKLFTLNKENNFVSIWKKIEHLEGTYEPEKICNFENSMLFLKKWQKQFWKEDFVKFENETNGIDFDCDYKEDIDNKKQSWFKFEEITMAVNMRGNRTWPVDNDNGSIIISLTPQNANCTLLDCLKGGKSEGADEDDTYVRSRNYALYRPKGEGSDGKRETFDNDFVSKK